MEKQDAVALADAIERLINDPGLRQQMGRAGRRLFEERFTEERFEMRLRECLEMAAGEGS